MKLVKNVKGQGMIEYLILVAIVAVSAIGVVRVVGENVSIQFANVAKALGSGSESDPIKASAVDASLYARKDLSNFLGGAISGSRQSNSKK